MGPSRWKEMAEAMQVGAEGAGLLAQAGGVMAGDAYSRASLPQRPFDALMQSEGYGQPPTPEMQAGIEAARAEQARISEQMDTDKLRLMQSQIVGRNPELGLREQPINMSFLDPEWLAASDEQMAEMNSLVNEHKFQMAMRRAALKAKQAEYEAEYNTPEAERERNRLAAEHWRRKNAS